MPEFRMHKFVAVLILLISMTACGNKKQIAAAKGNSVAYAKARCACEKQKKKTRIAIVPTIITCNQDAPEKVPRFQKVMLLA